FCSEAETPGVFRPAGLAAIMLAAGEHVVCDWYITNPDMNAYQNPDRTRAPTPTPPPPLPEGTRLTVSAWTCSKNYVDDDYGESCRQHPGEGFRYAAAHVGYLDAPATGPDGFLQFDLSGMRTKAVIISTWPPDGSRQYYASIVDCQAADNRLEVRPLDTLAAHTMVAVPVSPGDQIHCDWYNIPYGGS
ncbi:MAG TPA: hypothetical protein VFL82_08440, partial [Thermomicrobiales bacterium]|nr:hypothetical protein [Thermomicrobiales bacterium]